MSLVIGKVTIKLKKEAGKTEFIDAIMLQIFIIMIIVVTHGCKINLYKLLYLWKNICSVLIAYQLFSLGFLEHFNRLAKVYV